MHFHSLAIWLISLASIICMLLRPRGIPEYVWVCSGAAVLVIARLLSPDAALNAVLKGVDVYLFLFGMMVLAELARDEGVFDWIADLAMRHAGGSPAKLFLLIYLTGTVVTALLSNDATAVVLTPAVLATVRRAQVSPKPYLFICAFIANAASFLLPISNPANIVIYGRQLPPLGVWVRIFLAPSLVAIVATYFLLRFLSRRDLQRRYQVQSIPVELSSRGRLAIAGLVLSAIALIARSAYGADLGMPTALAGVATVLFVALKDRAVPMKVARDVTWSVLFLVAGLFVIVEALSQAGLLQIGEAAIAWLVPKSQAVAGLSSAFGVAAVSNLMNNLPVALASGAALQHLGNVGVSHAVLLGVDLGPNLSVTGSLATILWLIALRREKVDITAMEFLKVGIVLMPVPLLLSVLVQTLLR
ncbi:MAG TPA: arsenic transporter [Candidatus Acidoferrales bacterium]|nr:arsenic transporter [Candidatus Acidoferrales bacterium]